MSAVLEFINFDDPATAVAAPTAPVIVEVQQGTEAWHQARCGYITGSKMADMLAAGRGLVKKKYMEELAYERLTGQPVPESFKSDKMKAGTAQEADARELYEILYGEVVEVGFIQHPTIPYFGASPDGLVGDDGMIEIKRRDIHIHFDLIIYQQIPRTAKLQMFAQMACSGRQWVDYCSYNETMPPKLRLIRLRQHRDEGEIAVLEKAVAGFNIEVNQLTEFLRGKL